MRRNLWSEFLATVSFLLIKYAFPKGNKKYIYSFTLENRPFPSKQDYVYNVTSIKKSINEVTQTAMSPELLEAAKSHEK